MSEIGFFAISAIFAVQDFDFPWENQGPLTAGDAKKCRRENGLREH
jgi:hypothetical protein